MLNNLQDTGDRGGRVHWADQDTPDRIDTLTVQPGNIANGSSEGLAANTTLLWDLNPIQLKLTHVYADGDGQSTGFQFGICLTQIAWVKSKYTQNMLSLKATHLLSASTVYDVTLSYLKNEYESFDPYFKDNFLLYSDSTAVAGISEDFVAFTRAGSGPRSYDFNGFPFTRPGATMADTVRAPTGTWACLVASPIKVMCTRLKRVLSISHGRLVATELVVLDLFVTKLTYRIPN